MWAPLTIFLIQMAVYGLSCLNTRAIASGNIPRVAMTAFLMSGLSLAALLEIVRQDSGMACLVAYVLGSVSGDVLGLLISKRKTGG